MNNRQALLGRLTDILAFRMVALIPLEFWRVPVLKWLIEIQKRVDSLDKLNLSEADYREGVKLAYYEGLIDWAEENPNKYYTAEERAWWLWYGVKLGVLSEDWGISRMVDTINKDYEKFTRNFERLQKDGLIPRELAALDFAALLLDPPAMNIAQIPPGDNFWYALGVKDAGKWHSKDGLTRRITVYKRLQNTGREFCRLLDNRYAQRDARGDRRIDKEKLESLRAASSNPKKKRKYNIDARLENSGIVHKGYGCRDDLGNIDYDYDVVDNSIDRVDTDQDDVQADTRLRLLEQLKPRELDLFNAELKRLEAEKTREQWYGADRAQRVTQQMKYLKSKYSKH